MNEHLPWYERSTNQDPQNHQDQEGFGKKMEDKQEEENVQIGRLEYLRELAQALL